MDWPTIIAKTVGIVLFIWTARSVYKHVKEKIRLLREGAQESQAVAERILNSTLLYLWLAFMVVFSLGMVLNN